MCEKFCAYERGNDFEWDEISGRLVDSNGFALPIVFRPTKDNERTDTSEIARLIRIIPTLLKIYATANIVNTNLVCVDKAKLKHPDHLIKLQELLDEIEIYTVHKSKTEDNRKEL